MSENSSTWLLGDAQVEWNGKFLGAGPVSLHLAPEYLAVRRDRMTKLQAKRVTGLSLAVTAVLPGPERLLEILDGSDSGGFALSDFAEAPFIAGATLKIYPADPQLRGFSFPAAFLRESTDATGEFLQNGSLKAVFECEANSSGVYFTRLAANARPTGLTVRSFPDLKALSQTLVSALATPLQATVNTNLSRETLLAGSGNQFVLQLTACRNFQNHAPRSVHYTLLVRGAESEHDAAIARLAAAANVLYGFRPTLTGFAPLACKIEAMEFNQSLIVQGMPYRESRIAFQLLLP